MRVLDFVIVDTDGDLSLWYPYIYHCDEVGYDGEQVYPVHNFLEEVEFVRTGDKPGIGLRV